MNMTIIPEDGFICINGEFLSNIDKEYISWVPKDIYAFQWYGDIQKGEIEYNSHRLEPQPPNKVITELGIFERAITTFEEELQRRAQAEVDDLASIEENIDYWENLRSLRNLRLTKSDWTQLKDVPFTEEQKHLWAIYRQKLRDLSENIEDPKPLVLDENHPSWPVSPS
jgi:hypothetical protein